MMLFEQGAIESADLPVARMKEHLRLGNGFADDGMQDALVESHLRAAIATIEGRIGKVLIARRFRWEVAGRDVLAMPVAPVNEVVSVVDAAGRAREFRLERDVHRPRLVVGTDASLVVVFDAGFGGWDALPADLAQAVLLLAAEFYENRHEAGLRVAGLPMVVLSLIERWRTVRVLGGGAA